MDVTAFAAIFIGLGATVAAMVFPIKYPAAPKWVIGLAWWGGIALVAAGSGVLLYEYWHGVSSAIVTVHNQSWFWPVLCLISGLAVGIWIDTVVRQSRSPANEVVNANIVPAEGQAAVDNAKRGEYIDHKYSFIFCDLPKREAWKVKIRFNRSGENLLIRLDYSSHSGQFGTRFSEPRQLFLKRLDAFTKGQDKEIDLAELDEGKRYWQWTTVDDEKHIIHGAKHKCRLVFIIDDTPVDDFNFIGEALDGDKNILLIGENRFAYAKEWRESG